MDRERGSAGTLVESQVGRRGWEADAHVAAVPEMEMDVEIKELPRKES